MAGPTAGQITKQFTAHYQPIVDLNTGAIAGFEALARVNNSDGSVSAAGALIENIERRPETLKALIRTILSSIRRDMVPLFDRHPHFYVSVNIAPAILGSGQILPMVEALELTSYLDRIVCEVTERQALTHVGRSALERARRSGMSVAIDDFGTGHSGLMQIVGLDFDILKIDHSLIDRILVNQTAARMLRGIVALAAALRLHTVAEGVESREEAFFLRAAGVDCGQGWFWSKAVSGARAARLLEQGCRLPKERQTAQKNLERICALTAGTNTVPFVRSIFHPSDFSKASELAFAHALAIALFRKTELVIMHAGGDRVGDWAQFPPVRRTLERWEVLAPGSPRAAVYKKLSMSVTKVSAKGNPVEASIRHIEKQKPDLVVLATRGRHGLPLWLKPSIAQAIACRTSAMTLFVPSGCRGIVSMEGEIQLRRILLPIDDHPDSHEAVVRAVRAAEAFGDGTVEIVILHVNGEKLPQYVRPESQACSWKELRRKGDVAATILEVGNNTDLIVMSTEGRHGVVDAMRGSVTERVVRGAPCPVLAIPAA